MKQPGIILVLAALSLAPLPAQAAAGLLSLDEAIAGAALAVEGKLQDRTEITIAGIDSPFPGLSDFLTDELSSYFIAGGKLTVLASGKAMETLDTEHSFQMSGMVDDESAAGIGHYLGARVVITGVFEDFDTFSQLRIRAIDVETVQVLVMYSARIDNTDPILASIRRALR